MLTSLAESYQSVPRWKLIVTQSDTLPLYSRLVGKLSPLWRYSKHSPGCWGTGQHYAGSSFPPIGGRYHRGMQGNCIHPAERGSSEAKAAKEHDVNECFRVLRMQEQARFLSTPLR